MSRNTKFFPRGFTLVELVMGAGILCLILGFVSSFFFSQRRFFQSLSKSGEVQERFRLGMWKIVQELKTGRAVIWPRSVSGSSIRSDSILAFKNFQGEIVVFFLDPEKKELRRCLLNRGETPPVLDAKPTVEGISSASFTVMGSTGKLVSIKFSEGNFTHLDAARVMNE